MKLLGFLFVSLLAFNASANDGGIYYIDAKVKKASQEETDATGTVFTIEGKEADILRRSLPKTLSVDPKVEKNDNTLAVIDKASGTVVMINCTNLDYDSSPLKKLKETKCTISQQQYEPNDETLYETMGDAEKLKAPVCSK